MRATSAPVHWPAVSVPLYIVDAFADAAFTGNPAAVVFLNEPRDRGWMQAVAAELNLPATAFVDADPDGTHGLRWLRAFTPTSEVDLCGHATLATTHILGGTQRFTTRSGKLVCTARDDGWVEMDFPLDDPAPLDAVPAGLRAAFPWTEVRRTARGSRDLLVEVDTFHDVRLLRPDFGAIAALDVRGVIVTAVAEEAGVDFVSRCFYPSVGIPEDAVSGSAHCLLASWWSPRLDRTQLVGSQISARGGVVRAAVLGTSVRLSGQAVIVSVGTLSA